jgi:predicted adenine nucleotide alpha hydrolase (AANH) superfamily ATPase
MSEIINFDTKMFELIKKTIDPTSTKHPTLLLHACCGPCLAFPLYTLFPYFAITVYFSNSNIATKEEYLKRLEVVQQVIAIYNKEYHQDIKLIIDPYEHETYMQSLRPLASAKEGGSRCLVCYKARLQATSDLANKYNFAYFATTLSSGKQKNSQVINEIGLGISSPKSIYLVGDFKKRQGEGYSVKFCLQHQIYRQNFCGCEYSSR